MTIRHIIVFGALVLIIAFAIPVVQRVRERAEAKTIVAAIQRVPTDQLHAAVERFAHDWKATNTAALPDSVPLRDLVSRGYFRAENMQGLENMDVTVGLNFDETRPQAVVIRVRAGDRGFVLVGDGSAQQVNPAAVERQIKGGSK